MSEARANTHTKRAVLELRSRIVNGEMAGGTRLMEVAVAEALGISRTPVREAMARLTEEGLLDRASGGGFVVRSFSLADVFDAIELRGVLEGTAARLAAERGVESAQLARLRTDLRRLDMVLDGKGTVEIDLYAEVNARFHAALARLAQSLLLQRQIERATALPFASPSAFVPDRASAPRFQASLVVAQAQHHAILDAIAAREGARAEHIAREHARIARRNLELRLQGAADGRPDMPGSALVVA